MTQPTNSGWQQGKQTDRPTYECENCEEPTETEAYTKDGITLYKCLKCHRYIDHDGADMGGTLAEAAEEYKA